MHEKTPPMNRPSRFVPRSTMSRDLVERGTNRLGLCTLRNDLSDFYE